MEFLKDTTKQQAKPTLESDSEEGHYVKTPSKPLPNPPANDTGYLGTMERRDAELRLANCPPGTFLTRWSAQSKSFVLSYVGPDKKGIMHIGNIRQEGGKLQVLTPKRTEIFTDMREFVNTMRNNKIVTESVSSLDYKRSPL